MKTVILFISLLTGFAICGYAQDLKGILKEISQARPKEQVQILLMGTTHFGQENYYKNAPKSDLFNEQRQKEVAEINRLLKKFNPDLIMVEDTPEEQPATDSLYTIYKTNQVRLEDIPYGRSEKYQFGYRLAKDLNHDRVFGVDYYESVSNRILSEGDNIAIFKEGLNKFSDIARKADQGLKEGSLSLKDYLLFLNAPELLDLAYQVMFVTPARIKNGSFINVPTQYVDTSRYIGAEYISVFYKRELKIYSNIVSTQLRQKGKRLLVIMGQRHAAVLTKIFENDPEYKIVKLSAYLD